MKPFCDECGAYMRPGEEQIFLGGGTFLEICQRCYRRKTAALAANTERKEAEGMVSQGVKAENG